MKSNKQGSQNKVSIYENDVMTVEQYVAVFRIYTDMTIYILGSKDDNELILSNVLDTIHDCFDKLFKHNIERKSMIDNMTAVILVIDETIDQGIIMSTDQQTILKRINLKSAQTHSNVQASGTQQETGNANSGSMFASVFASAKNQLAKTLAL